MDRRVDRHPSHRVPIATTGILCILALLLALGGMSCASKKQAQSGSAIEQPGETSLHGEGTFLVPPSAQERWSYSTMPSPEPSSKPNYMLKNFTFAKGSATLNNEAVGVLREFAKELKANSKITILVVGLCDIEAEKVNAENLGMSRAQNTRKFLINQGISRDRVEAASFGSSQANAPVNEPIGQARDRRAEVWLLTE